MKAKLHKMVSGYILSLSGDIDDPYAIVNEELAEDYGWRRLSLRNCQAIECGYDLDEIAEQEFPYDFDCPLFETLGITEKSHKSILIGMLQGTLQKGFQKALELMGDKKFSINEVVELCKILISNPFETSGKTYQELTDNYIQSLQQTEWEVEIVEECLDKNCDGINKKGECITTGKPKLDADGCLILKRI